MTDKYRRCSGEGTIVQRKDGRWVSACYLGYDMEKGKPKRRYFYGKTRAEVVDKLQQAQVKASNGNYQHPSKMLFADYLDAWLNDYMKPCLRPTTWESYEIQVRRHIKPNLGHLRLNQLQTSHFQKLYNDKLSGGRADYRSGGLSPKSVRYIHNAIHGVLEQAKKEGLISTNPSDSVKLPKLEDRDIKYLDADQVKTLLNKAKDSNFYALYLLAISTGLRRGEILALKWNSIDLDKGLVNVSRGLVRTKEGLVFHNPKTKLGKRSVSIPQNISKELKAYKIEQIKTKLAEGRKYSEDDLVFTTKEGSPIEPTFISKHFKKLIKGAELPKVSFHGLRHSYATLNLQEGVDIKTIQENLGHHKSAFTLDVYSDVTNKMRMNATDKIGKLLAYCMDG